MDLNEFAQNISNLGGEFYRAAQNSIPAQSKAELLVSSHLVLENVGNLLRTVFENLSLLTLWPL